MVTKPFKIGPFEMSLRLCLFFRVNVLMGVVPGAKDPDLAGLRPAGRRPEAGRRPGEGQPPASRRPTPAGQRPAVVHHT